MIVTQGSITPQGVANGIRNQILELELQKQAYVRPIDKMEIQNRISMLMVDLEIAETAVRETEVGGKS